MKCLCVCNGGHVRSVTLARLLNKRGYECLVAGVDKDYSPETLLMLFNWADKIFFQKDSYSKLLERINSKGLASEFFGTGYESKADFRYDVGPDDWKKPQEDSLMMLMRDMIREFPPEMINDQFNSRFANSQSLSGESMGEVVYANDHG